MISTKGKGSRFLALGSEAVSRGGNPHLRLGYGQWAPRRRREVKSSILVCDKKEVS